ncbi:MAG: hypothetical protein EP306_06895 [Burkholderiales bacterium]|nr:MAG: hypothetical protein EP306_06895 [Burkholderiales bacterium]
MSGGPLAWLPRAALATAIGLSAGAAAAQVTQVRLLCEAVYEPARTVWSRAVEIDHDDRAVRAVRIDGVPVYSFAVDGNLIMTSLDNERIQVDVALQSWHSDFRGLAEGQGRCERAP